MTEDTQQSESVSAASACYDVRCFRTREKGSKRHGVWIMTQNHRGLFVHGGRDEIQSPAWSVSDLLSGCGNAEEITPAQALQEVGNWPEGARDVQRCFDRHRKSS